MSFVYAWPTMEEDLAQVEDELVRALPNQRDDLLGQISSYLAQGQGKRLRASMVVLAAHFGNVCDWGGVFRAAAAVELTHLATLIHDDLIDQASVRRGQPAVHVRWTPAVAILVGDYFFARSLTMMNRVGNPSASHYLTTTITDVCQGEISQQEQAFLLDLTEAQYLTRITQKTASFFASACAIGASLAQREPSFIEQLHRCGLVVGIAYQVLDDLLDLTATPEAMGKPVGNDLRHGTLTLPVIHGLRHERWGRLLARLVVDKETDLVQVRNILTDCGSFAYTLDFINAKIAEAQQLLAGLPDQPAKQYLQNLAQSVLAKQSAHPIDMAGTCETVASGDGR